MGWWVGGTKCLGEEEVPDASYSELAYRSL